jgi:acyl-CoA dehydrogenase
MIIPKEYGGLGFSALAHSEVLCKIATRSMPACITVMVPNSLGPAELLNHYGTEEQKRHYLPRLARGEEIPCFALTEPGAGSDAGSLTSHGVVFKGTDGKLYIKLNWNKRWITLSAISTVLGLAFRLYDPENLLGKGKDLGITCALIPTKTPGVVANRRHDPMGIPFYNCPTQGHDVVVSVDAIIGGPDNAGQGWKMLMECLAAGRGISLPAQGTGGVHLAGRVISAHATVRRQFGVSIGKFEGIEEPLARIGSFSYLMEAARRYTLGALDKGSKPPVITAMMKYSMTELARKVINDAMDVQGGQAISRGPTNLLANMYAGTPIAITVEGANILTRTLIIFGQGALRAHPFAYKEVEAVEKNDLQGFDRAFWGHIGHVVRNLFRFILLSLTRGRLVMSPVSGPMGRYYKKLAWASAAFAFMSDLAMGTLAAKLKFREKITGRFADALANMYLATAVMRRWEAEGSRSEDLPYVYWSLDYCFHGISEAFDGIYANMRLKALRLLHRFNPMSLPPSDRMGTRVATLMQTPGEQRDRIFNTVHMPKGENEQLNKLEHAFKLSVDADNINAKIRKAVHQKKLTKKPMAELIRDAAAQGIITALEAKTIEESEVKRNAVIQVDDFGLEGYKNPKAVTTGASGSRAG